MKIEIWSDFACPYCYIGEKKLEKAVDELNIKKDIELSFRSFQLDVNATSHPDENIDELIAKKYNISLEQAKSSNESIVNTAKEIGLDYDFVNLKPSHTGMAHQVAKYAKTKGLEYEMVQRLFSAYFVEGVELGAKENLLNLAKEVGLNIKDVEEMLNKNDFKQDVLDDQDVAREMGVSGVPFFVIDNKYAVSGAQSVEHFKQAIQQANTESE